MAWVMVALGGAGGSLLRYAVGRLAIHYLGPSTVLGTFLVNVSGSFALGVFISLALQSGSIPANLRLLMAVGFLGGYTTFSTFSFESVQLIQAGEHWRAAASVLGNVVCSLAAAYLGILLGRALA
jgi:fluoride exporter